MPVVPWSRPRRCPVGTTRGWTTRCGRCSSRPGCRRRRRRTAVGTAVGKALGKALGKAVGKEPGSPLGKPLGKVRRRARSERGAGFVGRGEQPARLLGDGRL